MTTISWYKFFCASFYHLIWLIVCFDFCVAKKCASECYTKTYTLANDYGPDCDHRDKCIVKAIITVIQQSSMDEKLNITLVGLKFKFNEERTMAIRFQSDTDMIVEYGCSVSQKTGKAKAFIIQGGNKTLYVGNVYYSPNRFSCHWILSKESLSWPRANKAAINLINEVNYRISLHNNNASRVVAWDMTKFPLYKMNFLRCCYRSYGGPHYLLITNQSNTVTNIYVQAFSPIPSYLTIKFRNTKGYLLTIVCGQSFFNATMKISSKTSTVRDILYAEPNRIDHPIPDFRCSWSQPVIITERAGTFDTRDGQFSLEILSDMRPPYREPVIYLRGFAASTENSLFLIIVCVAISIFIL